MRSAVRSLVVAALLGASYSPLPAAEPNDPMRPERPLTATHSSETPFHLSAVFVSAKRRSAVVNGQLVREGQQLGGARVVAIEADRVTLDVGGVERIARLNHQGTTP